MLHMPGVNSLMKCGAANTLLRVFFIGLMIFVTLALFQVRIQIAETETAKRC